MHHTFGVDTVWTAGSLTVKLDVVVSIKESYLFVMQSCPKGQRFSLLTIIFCILLAIIVKELLLLSCSTIYQCSLSQWSSETCPILTSERRSVSRMIFLNPILILIWCFLSNTVYPIFAWTSGRYGGNMLLVLFSNIVRIYLFFNLICQLFDTCTYVVIALIWFSFLLS